MIKLYNTKVVINDKALKDPTWKYYVGLKGYVKCMNGNEYSLTIPRQKGCDRRDEIAWVPGEYLDHA
jgi:hypothetical protein